MNTELAMRGLVDKAMSGHARGHQTVIGPSEIGMACDHCLAARLAGWRRADSTSWMPTVGTAVHSWLEAALEGEEWVMTERKVMVGWLGEDEIWGTCDAYFAPTGTVVDYKVVGPTTLAKVKRLGPSAQYRSQVHLYGRGVRNAGDSVASVAIWYLPRNAASLDAGYWWEELYDATVADAALARAQRLAEVILAVRPLSVDVLNDWIGSLPRDADCFDCARYPDAPRTPSALLH